MRLRNLFIDKVILITNRFLTRFKTRARNYDEFIVFYYDFFERHPVYLEPTRAPRYEEIKYLFVFEKLSSKTFLNFIAEGQKRGHLLIIDECGIPDFNDIKQLNGSIVALGPFVQEKFYNFPDSVDGRIEYFMPIPDDLCEDYVKEKRKESRNKFINKLKNNFSFVISLISATFILYTLYMWVVKGIPPISNP